MKYMSMRRRSGQKVVCLYMKYGEKADTCSIFATVYPNHFELCSTRTVRKSNYTPALVLPKHTAGIFDEKCREKEKYREQQIGECPFSIPVITRRCEPVYQI